ncbi:MAG: hypothetical protein LBV64_03440 [Mediterranea sp.]|nr:hypothetical protein [Mediterranea sp.]
MHTGIIHGAYRNYDGSIREYASGIPELRRLHNSRMVYTKRGFYYISYENNIGVQSDNDIRFAVALAFATGGNTKIRKKTGNNTVLSPKFTNALRVFFGCF